MIKKNIKETSNLRVIWKDLSENYSKEKRDLVKSHYQKLYGTKNVNVVFEATNKTNLKICKVGDQEIENVQDKTIQEKLLVQFLTENNIDVNHDSIKRLNTKVDGLLTVSESSDISNWEITKVTMDNFLSYGNLTTINYQEIKGLTIVPSKNQSGKSTFSGDILLFILFGVTTKTSKNEEIFNIYTDKDYVLGQAHVKFDNVPYIIERRLTRKLKKDNTWNITSSLKFMEVLPTGEFKELSEENRDTNKNIGKIIGNAEDFLLTVLCTGNNLESLTDSDPAERGRVLTKFLGLEVFAKKEKIAKDLEKDWKAKSSLVRYNLIDLKTEIENKNLKQETNLLLIEEKKAIGLTYDTKLKSHNSIKDSLMLAVRSDIDPSVDSYDIDELNITLKKIEADKSVKNDDLTVISKKVFEYGDISFDEKGYNDLIQEKIKIDSEISVLLAEIKMIDSQIENLKSGEKCNSCGQALKNINNSSEIVSIEKLRKSKIDRGSKLRGNIDVIKPKIELLNKQSEQFKQKERDVLMKDKLEIDIENLLLKLESQNSKIAKYQDNIDKIEKNKEIKEKIRVEDIEIDLISKMKSDLLNEIQSLETENRIILTRIDEVNLIIKEIQKDENVAKIFSTYIETMSKNGISKTILKNIIPQINYELEQLMLDICDFTTLLEINIENNKVEFWMQDNNNPIKKSLKTGSGFEKTVAALALRVVLNRVNTLPKLNLLVLDEIMGKVSHENKENIKLFLNKIKEYFDNIILITHDITIADWGDNLIEVVKENNISKLLLK